MAQSRRAWKVPAGLVREEHAVPSEQGAQAPRAGAVLRHERDVSQTARQPPCTSSGPPVPPPRRWRCAGCARRSCARPSSLRRRRSASESRASSGQPAPGACGKPAGATTSTGGWPRPGRRRRTLPPTTRHPDVRQPQQRPRTRSRRLALSMRRAMRIERRGYRPPRHARPRRPERARARRGRPRGRGNATSIVRRRNPASSGGFGQAGGELIGEVQNRLAGFPGRRRTSRARPAPGAGRPGGARARSRWPVVGRLDQRLSGCRCAGP